MAIEKQLLRMRGTVFTDSLISFDENKAEQIKSVLSGEPLYTVLLQNLSNVFLPTQAFQDWGLRTPKTSVLEIRANKIDIFSTTEQTESDFCDTFANKISQIQNLLNFKIRRLAFAPSYSIKAEHYRDFIEINFKKSMFQDILMQDFSFSRVFYKNELINGSNYEIIYNSNISIQPIAFSSFNENRQILINQDINTKDLGKQIFTKEDLAAFYHNVPLWNENYLKMFVGE